MQPPEEQTLAPAILVSAERSSQTAPSSAPTPAPPATPSVGSLQEPLYLALLQTIPQLVWMTDADGRPEYFNPQWREYTRFDVTDDLAANWAYLLHPEDGERAAAAWQRAVETGEPYEVQYRLRRHDGVFRWFLVRGVPLRDADGRIVKWFGSCTDIDRNRREEEKQHFLDHLSNVTRTLSDPEAVMWTAMQMLGEHLGAARATYNEVDEANDRVTARRDYCREGESITGTFPLSAFGSALMDDLRAGRTAIITDAAADPRTAPMFETMYRNLDIRSFIAAPLLKDGHLVTILSVNMIATRAWTRDEAELVEEVAARTWQAVQSARQSQERQRIETALHAADAQLRRITDAAPVLLSYVDKHQVFRFNNQTYAAWFGRPLEEITGRHIREVLGPKAYEAVRERVEAALAGQTVRFEQEMPYSSAPQRYVQITFVPDKAADGGVQGFVAVVTDFTERKRAEQALRASETRFRLLVEQSPLSIQILSPEGRTVQVNRAWEELWGMTLADLADYNMLQDQQLIDNGIMPYIRRAFAGEAVAIPSVLYDPDVTLPDKSQRLEKPRWTRAFMYPVRDEAGQVNEVVLIHEDITDQVHAESARAYLTAIIQSSEDAIVSTDLNGRVTSWNPAAERIYGYTAEEIVGQSKAMLIPPELPDELSAILREIRAGQHIEHYETLRLRKDGRRINLSITVSPILSAAGQVIGASTIARDITERIRADEERERLVRELSSQRQRLDDIVSSIPGVVWEARGLPDSENQRINFVSGYVEAMLGYTTEEWLSTPNFWLMIMHPDDREQAARVAMEAWEKGDLHTNTFRWIRKDGQAIWCESYSVIIHNAAGEPIGMRGVTLDVTERRQAEIERARHLAEIERLNVRLQRSIQETHHRVKNNLQIMAALAEVQMNEGEDTVPVSAMQRMGQHTRSLAAIHDLLVQGIRTDAHADRLAATALLRQLIPLLDNTSGGRPVRHVSDELALPVREGASLALLVSELVSNALKHGEGAITVELRVREDVAHLDVRDEGPGFPAGFDPNKAANTGLALIDSLARHDLRGTLTFENHPEGGGRVHITFPLPALD